MVDVGSGELNESIEFATCLLAAHFHPRFTVLSGTAGAQNAELMWATWSWAGTRWTNRPATMSSVVTRQGKDPIGAQIAAQQAAMETIEAPGAAQPGLAQVRSRALQPPGRPAAGGRLGHSP